MYTAEISTWHTCLLYTSYLTVTTGKIDHNSRIYSKDFDKIPIEILLGLIAGDIAVIGYSMFRLLGEIHLNAVLVICYGVEMCIRDRILNHWKAALCLI